LRRSEQVPAAFSFAPQGAIKYIYANYLDRLSGFAAEITGLPGISGPECREKLGGGEEARPCPGAWLMGSIFRSMTSSMRIDQGGEVKVGFMKYSKPQHYTSSEESVVTF
jgi:hypothetical protein